MLPMYNLSQIKVHSEMIVLPMRFISYSNDSHLISSWFWLPLKYSLKIVSLSVLYGALTILQPSFGCVTFLHCSTDIFFRWSGRAHQKSLGAAWKFKENFELLNFVLQHNFLCLISSLQSKNL